MEFRYRPIKADLTGVSVQINFSSVLGIAIEEGIIRSEHDRVADYYPEMLEIAPAQGPKRERYAFADNEEITFKQLIGNISGYMKPGEAPGQVFNYQTFGMNVLTHAVASACSLYKTANPHQGAGFGTLTE